MTQVVWWRDEDGTKEMRSVQAVVSTQSKDGSSSEVLQAGAVSEGKQGGQSETMVFEAVESALLARIASGGPGAHVAEDESRVLEAGKQMEEETGKRNFTAETLR